MFFSVHCIPLWLTVAVTLFDSGPAPATTRVFSFSLHDSVFQVGEELTYNVRYAVLDLGQVRIKVVDAVNRHDSVFYKAVAYIDSYQGVPFVDVHTRYESHIDASVHSLWFHSRARTDSKLLNIDYEFNYPRHEVVIAWNRGENKAEEKRDTLGVDSLTQDGLSLFYFARTQLLSRQNMSIPTVVSEKKGKTEIRFTNERVGEKIDAVSYPVDLIHFEGNADFVGVLGLTGEFEGWCSNDAARVPVIANMKLVIGEVHIELMKWKREGWTPPRFREETEK